MYHDEDGWERFCEAAVKIPQKLQSSHREASMNQGSSLKLSKNKSKTAPSLVELTKIKKKQSEKLHKNKN